MFASIVLLVLVATVTYVAAQGNGQCASLCDDLRYEVLTMEMCREAKKTLPRPKVGDFCSLAMEQGFADACVPLCTNQKPVSRVAQACRAASMEMPRPTVRKWCEHGYTVAFDKTWKDLKNHFKVAEPAQPEVVAETIQEEPAPEPVEIVLTIPVSIDDQNLDIKVQKGQSAEEAVVAFCREHVQEDIGACIRQLLPVAMEKFEEAGIKN